MDIERSDNNLQLLDLHTIEDCSRKICELENIIYKYQKIIKSLDKTISDIKSYKHYICEKNGHEWFVEREDGMYGEEYEYCLKCNLYR